MANPEHEETLRASCPSCGKGYRLKSSLAGKKAKCAACKETFTICAAPSSDNDSPYRIEDESPPTSVGSPPPLPPTIEIVTPPAVAPATLRPPIPPPPVSAPLQSDVKMIEELPSRIESALKDLLRPGETVYVKLKGAFKEGLICTDTRVILLKGGFMTGQMFGTNAFQLPYTNVAGVEVKFHLVTGYFELSAGGMQNKPKSYWSIAEDSNSSKAPNCISLNNPQQANKFREACSFILEKAGAARSPRTSAEITPTSTQSPQDQVLASLERLGELRKKGVITEEEFQKKKQDLLQRL